MESHNNQKKMAVINDLTGFGRCALTVAIPVISVMGLECCPVPTSILSNHTAFPSCFIDDYTEKMDAYINEWRKLGLIFDGIYSGFLGSSRQIDIVRKFFRSFSGESTCIIIDPVMGDNGVPYRTYTPVMCNAMKELVKYGNIITPNVTEACILTDTPYKEQWDERELYVLAGRLSEMGPDRVVITGVPAGEDTLGNYCMDRTGSRMITVKRAGKSRCGTGDLFASIIAADAVQGVALEESVNKAARFVAKTIKASEAMEIPLTDGVCFEYFLGELGSAAAQLRGDKK